MKVPCRGFIDSKQVTATFEGVLWPVRVEKLFFSVFQQPKFVRKLLIVRSPQALKLLLWFFFQQPRLLTSTISVATYESSALRPQISARIDKLAAGRKTVW
jgi:hypothetical protein